MIALHGVPLRGADFSLELTVAIGVLCLIALIAIVLGKG